MSQSISGEISALALGERAVLRGVHVVRRSLFGYQVAADPALLDAAEAEARVAGGAMGLAKGGDGPVKDAEVCFRCAGDGRGRRNRGVCGVCHGRGTLPRRTAA